MKLQILVRLSQIKKIRNKKNVSYLVAPKNAEEEFLAGVTYGMFNR